ncbi:MAG: 5-oxoprolinase subunit PxpB [Opitutaceae bacterium]|nr:5-oxoprolinase subunit PxpB [Opitutaceae bacterium]
MTLLPLGDSAVSVGLGALIDEGMAARVRALAAEIARHPPRGLVDLVPAFASVAVFYDINRISGFERLCADLEALVTRSEDAVVSTTGRRIEIPVTYGGEFGPDLEAVAAQTGLRASEVIASHASADYLVHAIGFMPGFPYLGGLPARLSVPRQVTPRPNVAAGSVGIGGAQTGIYPVSTPGGWNIIGRTPRRLFDPARAEPALLRPGDNVKFRAIDALEFERTFVAEQTLLHGPAEAAARAEGADISPGIQVLRAGMFTTVQDLGRTGHRAGGIAVGGAADAFALRVANLLVGNAETAAGLEFTLVGPEVVFLHDTVVAVGGAEFGGVPRWQPYAITAGTRVNFGAARSGCRGYLAIAGGIAVPPVLGSRSTHVRAGFGGLQGRPIREGDLIPVPDAVPRVMGHWRIDERILPRYSNAPEVRVVAGAERRDFGPELCGPGFKASPQSDRMGLRLSGPMLARQTRRELLSSAVAPGTIQIPPDGQPIVLLADAQTIGGYPQAAHVISVDLPVVAQLRPGDTVRFREVALAEAHELALAREHALAMLREGLAQKLG